MTIREQIEQAEILREQGKPHDASLALSLIIKGCEQTGNADDLALALAHRILCDKHIFQNGGWDVHLEFMNLDIEQGLALPISPSAKSVFMLRKGDYLTFQNKLEEAEAAYAQAYQLVEKDGYTEAEYLGHWAEAKARVGKIDEALTDLATAVSYMKTCLNVRPFHKAVIISGLRARTIKPALSARRYGLAGLSFAHGYSLAWLLALRYRMPQRLKQFHQQLLKLPK